MNSVKVPLSLSYDRYIIFHPFYGIQRGLRIRNKHYVFTHGPAWTSTHGCSPHRSDNPSLHRCRLCIADYDTGKSDPQDWDKIPSQDGSLVLVEEHRDIFPKDLPAKFPLVQPSVTVSFLQRLTGHPKNVGVVGIVLQKHRK